MPRVSTVTDDLRERWERSSGGRWPAARADWHCPELEAVCVALAGTGGELHAACRSLGEQRAALGIHLDDARRDLGLGLRQAGTGRVREEELLDALTLGWVESSIGAISTGVLVDRNEMANLPYLALRLGELYREAQATGGDVSRERALVVVETAETRDRLVAETRLTVLHSALTYAFVGGESIVAASSRRVVVLARTEEPRLSDSLARLRSELKIALSEGRLPSVHSWRARLPEHAYELSLAELGGLI